MARLVVVPVGILLGFLAATLVLAAGAAVTAAALPLQTSRAMFDALAWAVALDRDGIGVVVGGALWRALVTVGLAPLLVASVLGEVTGRRSLLALSGVTGVLAVLVPLLAIVSREAGRPVALEGSGRVIALLFLSGVAGGAGYWLVAGASTSRSARDRPSAAG